MIGLLKKEYYLMEGQMKSWLIVAIFCFFYSYFMNADSFLFMLIILIGIMSTMTVFSLDKACGWDTYAISLPLTRKEIVEARYLFAFLIDIGVSLACCLLMLLRGLISGGVNIPESLHSLFQILLVTILMQLLLFPVIYKLGVEKARFVYMAVFICLSLGVLGLSRLDDNGAVLAGIRINAEKPCNTGKLRPLFWLLPACFFPCGFLSVSMKNKNFENLTDTYESFLHTFCKNPDNNNKPIQKGMHKNG